MHVKDEEELRTIFEETYPSKVRARDVAGYVSLFAEDGIWAPPDAVERRGHAEIAEGVAAVVATLDIEPTFTADEVVVIGSLGYVFGRSKELLHPRDGSPSSVAYSRELWVFRKEKGCWKISRMLWNMTPSRPSIPLDAACPASGPVVSCGSTRVPR